MVWRTRPPRPGRARPVTVTGRRVVSQMKKGWPPDDLLTQVLQACVETGMMARVDLGPLYHHATVVMASPEPPRHSYRRGRTKQRTGAGAGTTTRQVAGNPRSRRLMMKNCDITTANMKKNRIWDLMVRRDARINNHQGLAVVLRRDCGSSGGRTSKQEGDAGHILTWRSGEVCQHREERQPTGASAVGYCRGGCCPIYRRRDNGS